MKTCRIIGLFSVLLLLSSSVSAQSWLKKEQTQKKTEGWIENFEQAKKEAKQFKQPMYVLFTGSDWCPWCIKLEKEALSTKEFLSFAKANLILFKADFLRSKPVPAKLKRQNDALARKFEVQGFPTAFLMHADEDIFGRTGYQPGGGKAYVEHLTGMLKTEGIRVVSGKQQKKALSPYEKMKAEREFAVPK